MAMMEQVVEKEIEEWLRYLKVYENFMIPADVITRCYPKLNFTMPQYFYDEYPKFPMRPRQLTATYAGYELYPAVFEMPALTPFQFALATVLSESVSIGSHFLTAAAYIRMRQTALRSTWGEGGKEMTVSPMHEKLMKARAAARFAKAKGRGRATVPVPHVPQPPPTGDPRCRQPPQGIEVFSAANRLHPAASADYANRRTQPRPQRPVVLVSDTPDFGGAGSPLVRRHTIGSMGSGAAASHPTDDSDDAGRFTRRPKGRR